SPFGKGRRNPARRADRALVSGVVVLHVVRAALAVVAVVALGLDRRGPAVMAVMPVVAVRWVHRRWRHSGSPGAVVARDPAGRRESGGAKRHGCHDEREEGSTSSASHSSSFREGRHPHPAGRASIGSKGADLEGGPCRSPLRLLAELAAFPRRPGG